MNAGVWNPRILVVEDDPLIGELLMLRLESGGYRATWVKDGGAALDRMQDVKPHLVVLDLGLPGVDGFQVLQTLRRHATWRETPVVVLTARHNADDVKRALGLGASDYVAKPFDAHALLKRIERALKAAGTKPVNASTWV
ncbi:MAG TPA: response regulator [Caulobacteraceae bacterium]|nr:response regulator [Caulobacteraceae bacterium]